MATTLLRRTRFITDYKKIILFLIISSIVLKLGFLYFSGAYRVPIIDEDEEAAVNLLQGKGFYFTYLNTKSYSAKAPGFALLCYTVYKLLGHQPLFIIFIQIVVTSLIVIPIYFIAHRCFNEETAKIAGFLTAFYPVLIVYSAIRLADVNLYTSLFPFVVYSILCLQLSVTRKQAILTGFICGLTIIFRATIIVFLIFALLWFYYVSRETRKKKIYAIATIIFVCFAIMLPWGIRNYFVFGKPLLLQTDKWSTLWRGNIPGSSGSLYAGGITLDEKYSSQLPADFFKMNEIEQGNYLRRLTIGYFRKDPLGFMTRIVRKMYYFWYFSSYQGSAYPRLWMDVYKIYYLCILSLALISVTYNLVFVRKHMAEIVLIGLLFLSFTSIHSLYYVEGRHRFSIEPLLLIFTANAIVIIKDNVRKIRPLLLIRVF